MLYFLYVLNLIQMIRVTCESRLPTSVLNRNDSRPSFPDPGSKCQPRLSRTRHAAAIPSPQTPKSHTRSARS
jgi:hypothetical protein